VSVDRDKRFPGESEECRREHTWATELMFGPRGESQDPRHVDSIWPIWSVLDMTPGGREPGSDFPGEDYE
jgi:predicted dithiol-disulfide oxidoreductase (DUF899 family)